MASYGAETTSFGLRGEVVANAVAKVLAQPQFEGPKLEGQVETTESPSSCMESLCGEPSFGEEGKPRSSSVPRVRKNVEGMEHFECGGDASHASSLRRTRFATNPMVVETPMFDAQSRIVVPGAPLRSFSTAAPPRPARRIHLNPPPWPYVMSQ